jgi:hypothetical protein
MKLGPPSSPYGSHRFYKNSQHLVLFNNSTKEGRRREGTERGGGGFRVEEHGLRRRGNPLIIISILEIRIQIQEHGN